MRYLILAAIAALALVSTAHAAMTGKDLMKACDNEEDFSQGFCFGFVAGIADGLDTISFCIPLDVTVSQEHATVQKYLREHTKQLELQAHQVVIETFKQAYPCN